MVTSNHVVGESYTLIRVRLGHAAAHAFLRIVRTSDLLERVFVPEELEAEAEQLLARFADQDFSYVDATSFALMRELRLTTAFTLDHHFQVAGFIPISET